ncbi:MAG: hypothetical protein O0V67_00980, partial [Methanocorpusculum sp.]|nr:hypothetical protein [Methanocorpusculum sp.]
HQQLPEKIPAKYLHSINTQILSVYSVSREAAVFCVFSVEFRGVCVFRGYSKQNQSKKNPEKPPQNNAKPGLTWNNHVSKISEPPSPRIPPHR